MIAVGVRCQVRKTSGSMPSVTTIRKIPRPSSSRLPVTPQAMSTPTAPRSGSTKVALLYQSAS